MNKLRSSNVIEKSRSVGVIRRAFTIIEMMMVIALVGLLLTITVMVTQGLVGQSKVRQCEEIMAALDSLLTEYESEFGSMPPFDASDFDEPKNGDAGEVRPEVSVFLEQVRGLKGADRILAGLPTQFLSERYEYYSNVGANAIFAGSISNSNDIRLTISDPWGIEILYIHPRDKRATVGKNAPRNFAGYGTPANDRPYFVSAGPDRIFYDENKDRPSEDLTRKDNIYSYEAVERPEQE